MGRRGGGPYQVEHGHLHHALVKVGRPVLDDLDRNNFLGLEVLTFDDLTKRALAEHVQDQIAVPWTSQRNAVKGEAKGLGMMILVARFFRSQNIIHIKDIVAVFIVVTVVLDTFARLGQYSAGISGRLVFEARVANAVCRRQMNRQRLERLRGVVRLAADGVRHGKHAH